MARNNTKRPVGTQKLTETKQQTDCIDCAFGYYGERSCVSGRNVRRRGVGLCADGRSIRPPKNRKKVI